MDIFLSVKVSYYYLTYTFVVLQKLTIYGEVQTWLLIYSLSLLKKGILQRQLEGSYLIPILSECFLSLSKKHFFLAFQNCSSGECKWWFCPASIKIDCHFLYIHLYVTGCLPLRFDSAACYLDTNCILNRINTRLKTMQYIIPGDAFIIKLKWNIVRISL